MADVKFTLDPKNPPKLSSETRARLDAKTDVEITRAAESDPDNPPLTKEEFQRIDTVRAVRAARAAADLTQPEFAMAYGLTVGRLRDLEQGRTSADTAMLYLLQQIMKDPAKAKREVAELLHA